MIRVSWLQLRINLHFYKSKLRKESAIKIILFRQIDAFCYIIIFSYINYILRTMYFINIHFKCRDIYKWRATILQNKPEKESRQQVPFFPANYFLLLCYLYLQISTFKIFGCQLSPVKINSNRTGSLEVSFCPTRNITISWRQNWNICYQD